MAYKISKNSENDLRKAISRFNSKIKRLEKVDREIDIPQKENISAIMERVSSKWDLNREIERLERFSKRNAEELIQTKKGIVLSRWELENLQREQKRLNAKLLREIERYGNIKPTELGKTAKETYAQMGDEKLSNLKARQRAISKKSVSKLNISELKDLQTLMNKTAAIYRKDKQVFYNNYLDGTLLNTAYYIGYDPDKIAYIRKKLNELSPTQFAKAFEQEQTLKDLQLRYNLTKEDIEEIFNVSMITNVSSTNLVDLLIEVGSAKSKREAREFISGNAVKINGVKNTDLEYTLEDKDFIDNTYIIIKRGKKNYYVGKKN